MEESSSNESMSAAQGPPPLPVLKADEPQTLAYGRLGVHLAPPPGFLRLCAHGSWVLTIIMCAVAMVVFSSGSLWLGARMILVWVFRSAIVAALAMGVIALVWNRKYRRAGILASAVIGLLLNSLVILGVVAVALVVQRQLAAIAASRSSLITAASSAQHYADALSKDDHWLGNGELHGAKLKFRGFPDNSPLAKDLAANFSGRNSFAMIYLDSSASLKDTAVDTADVSLHYNDGSIVKSLNPNRVLATARTNQLAWMTSFRSPVLFAAGTKTTRMATIFFPGGTDFSQVAFVVITVDGQPITRSGRFYTAAELTMPPVKPRWIGRTSWEGTQIAAGARKASQLAVSDPYRRCFRGDVWVVSFTVDASAVDHAVSLDTSATAATLKDNRIVNPFALGDVLDETQPGAAEVKSHQATPLVVQGKTRSDRSVIVIFPAGTDFEQVSYLTVHLDGVELLVRHAATNKAISPIPAESNTPAAAVPNPSNLPDSRFSLTGPPPGK